MNYKITNEEPYCDPNSHGTGSIVRSVPFRSVGRWWRSSVNDTDIYEAKLTFHAVLCEPQWYGVIRLTDR